MKKTVFCLLSFVFLLCSVQAQHKKFEMRGVWVATVANIDFPSRAGLPAYEQRNEMRALLNELAKNKINCIIMQIRPTADAFYFSPFEPWSQWLTGKQGNAPVPFYDPLQFIIEEAHKRCMEIHVWLNPYRVSNSGDISQLSREHLYFKNKNLFLEYGGKYYFDPGLDETRDFLGKIVGDIVERYDIDAIHFDDYFYPYPVAGKAFPDEKTFKKIPRGFKNKDDWRRNNVNMVIEELQQIIREKKPWVEFGISPFGVWRNSTTDPRGSATQAGIQNYDDLYADILKWLREGTIDYVTPQIYWEIGKKVADYEVLVKWWAENSFGKNLYIGTSPYRLSDKQQGKAWNTGNEIERQMTMNLDFPQVDGVMFFSAKPFLKNLQNLNDILKKSFYKYEALNPANRNIRGDKPATPQNLRVLRFGKETYITWDKVEDADGCATAYYVVYAYKGTELGNLDSPAGIIAKTQENCLDLHKLPLKIFKGNYTFAVTAVNRYREESAASQAVTKHF